jgi:hypothetical protein
MIEDVSMLKLRKRMYYFVIYQLMGIQKGIQCDHASKLYGLKYATDEEYIDYVYNHATIITLDGGTTNDDIESPFYGSINEIADDLEIRGIKHSTFREPDLNNAMTAVCFLADERVWDFEKFPDFEYHTNLLGFVSETNNDGQTYEAWVEYMGGENNLFLRELTRNAKLAKN